MNCKCTFAADSLFSSVGSKTFETKHLEQVCSFRFSCRCGAFCQPDNIRQLNDTAGLQTLCHPYSPGLVHVNQVPQLNARTALADGELGFGARHLWSYAFLEEDPDHYHQWN
jgi:hypothetical protein